MSSLSEISTTGYDPRMTQLIVNPSSLTGTIKIPPSKSQTLRALLFASLAKGTSLITNPLMSPDSQKMIDACLQLGATIKQDGQQLVVHGNGGVIPSRQCRIDAGNSGIVLRFLSTIAAISDESVTFSGDASLCRRPMHILGDALVSLGVQIDYLKEPGFAPLSITGPVEGSSVTLEGGDSQPVSALLIAASLLGREFEITALNPGEKPWIEMTLDWLNKMGVSVRCQDFHRYTVNGNGWPSFNYSVPGDWSTAAFPLIAAIVTRSELLIEGLTPDPCQGDQKILQILESMGAHINFLNDTITVLPNQTVTGIDIDVNDCIDALPALTVMACFAKGTTRLYNAAIAKTKECDRIVCMAQELTKMGAHIKTFDDGVLIEGSSLHGGVVDSHGDHRIAMALTVAALGASTPTTIRDVECIAKTYPNFSEEFAQMGACL